MNTPVPSWEFPSNASSLLYLCVPMNFNRNVLVNATMIYLIMTKQLGFRNGLTTMLSWYRKWNWIYQLIRRAKIATMSWIPGLFCILLRTVPGLMETCIGTMSFHEQCDLRSENRLPGNNEVNLKRFQASIIPNAVGGGKWDRLWSSSSVCDFALYTLLTPPLNAMTWVWATAWWTNLDITQIIGSED